MRQLTVSENGTCSRDEVDRLGESMLGNTLSILEQPSGRLTHLDIPPISRWESAHSPPPSRLRRPCALLVIESSRTQLVLLKIGQSAFAESHRRVDLPSLIAGEVLISDHRVENQRGCDEQHALLFGQGFG